jgi:hypothetical protein
MMTLVGMFSEQFMPGGPWLQCLAELEACGGVAGLLAVLQYMVMVSTATWLFSSLGSWTTGQRQLGWWTCRVTEIMRVGEGGMVSDWLLADGDKGRVFRLSIFVV